MSNMLWIRFAIGIMHSDYAKHSQFIYFIAQKRRTIPKITRVNAMKERLLSG